MGRLGSGGLGGPGLSRAASLLGGPGLEDNLDPERVFYALDDFSGSFVNDVIIGKGVLTEARTSTIFLVDDAGIWQPFTSGVPGEVYANARWWLYGGPAGTNELTFSRDLTDAVWVETGTAVAAFDAVGLEGTANTASTLTDDDGASRESIVDAVTIPNNSDTHVLRVFLDVDTDESRFPEFQLAFTGGTSQLSAVQINTKTGAFTERTGSGTTAREVNRVGNKWELLISVANNTSGNMSAAITIRPAMGTTFGGTEVAATGSIIVGNVEIHINKTIAQVRGSTPIFTSGSTVTVDATDLSFDDANHADLEGAYFCEFKNVGLDAVNLAGLIGLGTSGRLFFNSSATRIKARDSGTNDALGPVISLGADDTEYKLGLAYGGANQRMNTDNSFGSEVTYSGAFTSASGKIFIARRAQLDGANVPSVVLLRNLRRYDLDYVAAQAKIDELMA